MAFESQAKLFVDKSLKIVKLIKNVVRLILNNFGIVGFLFSAVYQYIRLTFVFVLIVFWAQNILFRRL
jgi:hypothetical protein